MKKPFVLFEHKKSPASKKAKERFSANMQEIKNQCEWLVEPSGSTPERSLGIAVLQRAVLDLITPGVDRKDRDDAIQWIKGGFGEEFEKSYPLSFSNITESFTDYSIDEFRAKILSFANIANTSEDSANSFRFQRG